MPFHRRGLEWRCGIGRGVARDPRAAGRRRRGGRLRAEGEHPAVQQRFRLRASSSGRAHSSPCSGRGHPQTSGRLVALTISPMRPAADWVATIRSQLERVDVVAGAIDPGGELRLSDWPSTSCAIRATCFRSTRTSASIYQATTWPTTESSSNRPVTSIETASGSRTSTGACTRAARSCGMRRSSSCARAGRPGRGSSARQRFAHGRAHGRQRGSRSRWARNVIGVLASPLVRRS